MLAFGDDAGGLTDELGFGGEVRVDIPGSRTIANNEQHDRATHKDDFAGDLAGLQLRAEDVEVAANVVGVHRPAPPPAPACPDQSTDSGRTVVSARLHWPGLHGRLGFHVPERDGHDDYLISLALAVHAAQVGETRRASGRAAGDAE